MGSGPSDLDAMTPLMASDDLQRVLRRIAHEILERHHGADDLVIVGIQTRGTPLARRLADSIGLFENVEVEVVNLDVRPYRDDLSSKPADLEDPHPSIPIEGRALVIVDDVLYTGRTVRAALDALSDRGRARTVELAVLVDRGHRELPIRADYVGKNLPTSRAEHIHVRLREVDDVDGVWIERRDE